MSKSIHTRKTAVILTALGLETSAVLRHLHLNRSIESVSGTAFHKGQLGNWDVVVAEVGAGNASAAAITVRACDYYKPIVAFFVGVAGGIKDVSLGDVVVATKVYGYESGKDKAREFQVRPDLLKSHHTLEQYARVMHQTKDWHALLNPQLNHELPTLAVGPIAAGEKVVASNLSSIAKFLRKDYGDALAVEMEGRGFLEGVHINHPVQGCVIRGISDLLSGKTTADRSGSQERAADAAAAVAFQMLLSGFIDGNTKTTIDLSTLQILAANLLENGKPPSITNLFPDALPTARAALNSVITDERVIIETTPASSTAGSIRTSISKLAFEEQRKHLILGPPGSGKTHSLWHAANQLLRSESVVIPLFLPAGQINSWEDLTSMINAAIPALSLDDVFQDTRICLFIDGWSEFASGEYTSEKQKALRALLNSRVIANGKLSDVSDTPFKIWSLESLSPQQVANVIKAAHPNAPSLPSQILDLLRLPLLLSIQVLSNGSASEIGDLLRQFHDHLARNLPEGFTSALAGAVAASELSGDRTFGRLISNLQIRATAKGITESAQLLRRLGTIVERHRQAQPVHDLYWNWLAGCGMLVNQSIDTAINHLRTRDSYLLALQSGTQPQDADIATAANDDLVLAATLDASVHSHCPNPFLAAGIERALDDSRLSVRSRGGLAALESRRSMYVEHALEILSELSSAKLHIADWQQVLKPNILFAHRAAIANWIGSKGTNYVLDAIAERGGAEWTPWLEQIVSAGKITAIDALGTALSCAADIPTWTQPYLDDFFRYKSWELRATAARRSNLALALHIASNYERLVETVINRNSSTWIDLNRVIVTCGNDTVFKSLLDQFGSMSAHAQELLGFAVLELGQPWIAEFQKVAFAIQKKEEHHHHHKLTETVSLEIDDVTARSWINNGYYQEGWRVLIARHGEEILAELIAALPTSFANLHRIPSLEVMRFLDQAPESLPDELLKRLGSPMQPKAMEDVLSAMAKAHPVGVPAIVKFIIQQPNAMPAYHIAKALRLYEKWRKKMNGDLIIQSHNGKSETFPQWITRYCAQYNWENHFTAEMLALSPNIAIEFVLGHLKGDVEKSTAVLRALKGLPTYDATLLDYMLTTPQLTKLIPDVFANAFDTFPVAELHRCIASPDIDQNTLLFRLGSTSNPLHQLVHLELIQRVLAEPIDLHHYRYIANMLRSHTIDDTYSLLRNTEKSGSDEWLWFVREVEAARGERLINETGQLRYR